MTRGCAAAAEAPKARAHAKDNKPMTDPAIDFASLLCSRLCHDLLSPVGALNNGLELLADETDPQMRARCMELLTESARASADKLKFFRLAFGAAGGFGDEISERDAKQAVEGLVRGNSKIILGWVVDRPAFSRGETRILLNLALIAIDALVRGGRLDIGVEGGDMVVRAEGPRLVLDAEVRAVLAGTSDAPMASRTIGASLIQVLAGQEGRSVQIAEQEGVLLLGASRTG